jgi:hypothetical protein
MLLVNVDSSEKLIIVTNFLESNKIKSKEIDEEDLLDYFLGKEMETVDKTDLVDKNEFLNYLESFKK